MVERRHPRSFRLSVRAFQEVMADLGHHAGILGVAGDLRELPAGRVDRK